MQGTILFLSHDASRSGAPIMLLNILGWLRRNRNFNFRVLTGKQGNLSSDFMAAGPTDSFQPSNALWYRFIRKLRLHHWHESRHLADLRESLLASDVALIYVNSVASAWLLDSLSFLGCPVICHVHELDGAIRTIGSESIALLEKRQPTYIAVSQAVRSCLVKNHGIPASRVHLIHGFVPNIRSGADDTKLKRKEVFEKLSLVEDAQLVCGCGSIETRKGTDLFLQVAAETVRQHSATPIHFVWVGGAPGKVSEMQGEATRAGLTDVIHFVGQTTNPDAYLAASDLFLLTSREDPFPLVVMEAAQYGNPIVCFSNAGGAPEFVEPDAGYVIPDFDVRKMSEKVAALLASPELRGRMGRAARDKVSRNHNLDLGGDRIAAIIESVMQVSTEWSAHRKAVLSR